MFTLKLHAPPPPHPPLPSHTPITADLNTDRSSFPLMNHPNGPLIFWMICWVLASGFLAYVRFSRQWI